MHELKQVQVRLRLAEVEPLYSEESISSPEKAVDVMSDVLSQLDREYFCIVNLDNKLKPINFNVVSIGDINKAEVSIQNVFKTAILSNAASIMALHNHPSGDIEPSRMDKMITSLLIEASSIMHIPLQDHIIIGAGTGKQYSFKRECGEIFDIGTGKYLYEKYGAVMEGSDLYKAEKRSILKRLTDLRKTCGHSFDKPLKRKDEQER